MSLTLPIESSRDHIQGSPKAPVTFVEYGDYECPYCGAAHPLVQRIQEEMGDDLRFVFRNFPLSEMHPHAEHAAEAAEAAAALGGEKSFWTMHDTLFENQRSLGDSHLITLAQGIGLDGAALLQEVKNGTHAERVREDFLSGVRSGVNGTPTFFINGARYDGSVDLESILAAMENV